MEHFEFKQSGRPDVDEAKFKQTVFLCGPPRRSESTRFAVRNIDAGRGRSSPLRLRHEAGAPYYVHQQVCFHLARLGLSEITQKQLQSFPWNLVVGCSIV